jgi:pimeloyl-[acyl-carrier protein] methyl ester esterase
VTPRPFAPMTRVVLLPGMDGTGRLFRGLFRGFVEHAPAGFAPEPVTLPAQPMAHDALARRLGPALGLDGGCILVAESYSGPLALRLAAEHPVRALVLCNSFVAPPHHRALRLLALPLLFRLGPPRAAIRRFFVGPSASPALVDEVGAAVRSVPPRVLAARLAEVLSADAGEWLARCTAPLLYLRGTDDRLVPEAAVRRITDACSARVARIPGPHLLLQAAPAAAWAAITRFLDDLDR